MEEKNSKWLNLIVISLLIIGLFSSGFYLGRETLTKETVVETEYIYSDPITDTVYFERPYKVVTPVDTVDIIKQCVRDGTFFRLFPEKMINDTIYVTKSDTTEIMKDWASKKFYGGVLFENDYRGKFTYDIELQYNELKRFEYTFTPVDKVITTNTVKTKKYSPYIGLGISTNYYITSSFGVFIDDSWGVGLNGTYRISNPVNEQLPKYDIGLMVYKKW